MAKSANSKVIFVPMQLQSDVSSSNSIGALVQNEAAESSGGLGVAGRAGILNSVADS
jgi:erythrocyte band 7 integral membrane protein